MALFSAFLFKTAYGAIHISSTWLKRLCDLLDKYGFDMYIVHMIYVKGPLNLVLMGADNRMAGILLTLVIIFISGIAFHFISAAVFKWLRRYINSKRLISNNDRYK